MSHCNTDKFNYFWICEPLARCAKRGSSLPLGTPMEIDFTSAYLHYPLPQCSKIVTPIIFSISYELFRLPSAKVPQDYQLLRTFVWKSWPGTMGHFLIRRSTIIHCRQWKQQQPTSVYFRYCNGGSGWWEIHSMPKRGATPKKLG